MKTFSSITEAAQNAAQYILVHLGDLPLHLQPLAIQASTALSPVERVVKSMEVMFSALEAGYSINPDSLDVLYSCADQVASSGFWGKGDRAVQLMKYARWKSPEWDLPEAPEVPALELGYAAPE